MGELGLWRAGLTKPESAQEVKLPYESDSATPSSGSSSGSMWPAAVSYAWHCTSLVSASLRISSYRTRIAPKSSGSIPTTHIGIWIPMAMYGRRLTACS